jgi:hypothetical protein
MPQDELSGPDLAGVVADADAVGLDYVVLPRVVGFFRAWWVNLEIGVGSGNRLAKAKAKDVSTRTHVAAAMRQAGCDGPRNEDNEALCPAGRARRGL